jgi:RimJ/RimL family protein N-acetyltransferase
MLKYAFETLGTDRIEIVTSTDNVRSQRAIERLGAVREGVLRKKYYNLDYVIYGLISPEWNEIKARLEGYLS